MRTADLDTKKAPCAWFALQDARMRNIAMESHYTEPEKVKAERMKLGLELVYASKGIHINYRKKFIAVKVDGARIRDRVNLTLLEGDWDKLGVKKAVTNQGVVYRIPKV